MSAQKHEKRRIPKIISSFLLLAGAVPLAALPAGAYAEGDAAAPADAGGIRITEGMVTNRAVVRDARLA